MALVLLFSMYQRDNAIFAPRTKRLKKKEVFGINMSYLYLYNLDYFKLLKEAQGSPLWVLTAIQ